MLDVRSRPRKAVLLSNFCKEWLYSASERMRREGS